MTGSEIKFIGTGSGKASLHRHFSSFIIYFQNYNLLVDAGDGISRALLSQKISFSDINGILLTHLHPDHYSGLASLIVQMNLIGRSSELEIMIHKNLKNIIENFLYHSYIFKEKIGFKILIKTFNHDEIFKLNDSLGFIGRQNSHLKKYEMYADEKDLDFSCSSFLFIANNRNIFYSGDIGSKEDIYLFKDNRIDLIISEITHVNIEDLLEAYKNLKPEKLYFTHLSDEDEENLVRLKNKLSPKEKNSIIIAFDGLLIQI
jgi:ribonuclease BN (tRNA processing enzyme)